MKRLIAGLLLLWLSPALAQVPMTGAGKGTPGGVAVFSIINTDTGTDNTSGTPITFTSKNIGAADSTRKVIIAIASRACTAFATAVTVDSISATSVTNSVALSGNNCTEIWIATVGIDSGHTTGNVVVTFGGGAPTRFAVGVYSMVNQGTGPNVAHGTTGGANPLTATVTIPTGGSAIGAGYGNGGATTTVTPGPSGFNSDATLTPAANNIAGIAHSAAGALTGSQNLTMTWDVVGNTTLSVAAWGP